MARIMRTPPPLPRMDGPAHAGWWHAAEGTDRLVCDLCPRACSLKPGDRGFCFVRENLDGQMVLSTYGRSTGFCVDPIEKKPLNHFLPGTAVLSFGTAGCNLGCKFCQNWDISKSREVARASETATPDTIAEAAVQLGCHSVAFTYNDPVIWAEYAVDTARACHARGLKTVAVTAGYITADARRYFFEHMDAANVDLKAFSELFYHELTYSHLQPVLDTLIWLRRESEVWFELTNLMIPGENDSADEVRRMCDWIVHNLGDDVPIHFTAFHPDFRMREHPPTPVETLLMAYEQARTLGIQYVYVGNVHDPTHDSTYCPYCSAMLIERNWHELGRYQLQGNRCHRCQGVIAGRFMDGPGTWGRRRLPVRISQYAPSVSRQANQHVSPATGAARRSAAEGVSEPPGEAAQRAERTPQLSGLQEQAVFRAACELIVGGVTHSAVEPRDPVLAGAAESPVMGVFVTLKRQGHLRACCGSLGRPLPLFEALRNAAHRTATDDQRLPPISATELPYLDVDVSLLSDFRSLGASSAERAASVEVGRHGLTIHRGQAGGLLLPAVAVEHDWDAETFLRQVCHKAGLPSNAWQDSSADVQTFEATVLEGTIDQDLLDRYVASPDACFTAEELRHLAEHCRSNVLALLQGATPSYYLPGCRDTTAQGVVLALHLATTRTGPQFARLSLRPGLPLQSTLYQLSESAARWVSNLRLGWADVTAMRADIAILYDSALQGTAGRPDLRGVDLARRCLAVATHGRYAWCYRPDGAPADLLSATADRARVFDPSTASVLSFAVDSTTTSFEVTNVPRPQAGESVRRPAVAGTFYPAEPAELNLLVDQLTEGAGATRESWPAVMVPHAGLHYSGRIAAEVFGRVALPGRAIVLAPKHTRLGTPWAIAPHETWSLPGQQVSSDPELAHRLSEGCWRLELDAAAHQEEHAIEVQLPLLARLAPDMKVVGIVIGEGGWDDCSQLARQLAEVLRDEAEAPLLVISTDLHHYASEPENRRLDQIALEAIKQLDPAHLLETIREHNISMCGVLPAVIGLQTLRELGSLQTCRQVAYCTSADAGGSRDRVVGYAGFLFG